MPWWPFRSAAVGPARPRSFRPAPDRPNGPFAAEPERPPRSRKPGPTATALAGHHPLRRLWITST